MNKCNFPEVGGKSGCGQPQHNNFRKVTFGLFDYNPARNLKSLMPKGRKNLGFHKVKM